MLGYHRVTDEADPLGLAVAVDRFAAHLEVIARAAEPLRLSDAVRAAGEGTLPRRAVVVTFDDGYSDAYSHVRPLLERAGVPATVFVTTGRPGRQFWWDELTGMVMNATVPAATLALEIRGRRCVWELHGDGPHERYGVAEREVRARTARCLARELQPLCPAERDTVMQAMRTWAGQRPEAGVATPRALTADEVRHLAASPYVDIGAHTVSHPVLALLSPGEQRREVAESRRYLQLLTGTPVTSFSYPHGSYSLETAAIVAEAGFTAACCSTPDVLTPRSNPLALPRLWVENQDGGGFAAWLRGWLHD